MHNAIFENGEVAMSVYENSRPRGNVASMWGEESPASATPQTQTIVVGPVYHETFCKIQGKAMRARGLP